MAAGIAFGTLNLIYGGSPICQKPWRPRHGNILCQLYDFDSFQWSHRQNTSSFLAVIGHTDLSF